MNVGKVRKYYKTTTAREQKTSKVNTRYGYVKTVITSGLTSTLQVLKEKPLEALMKMVKIQKRNKQPGEADNHVSPNFRSALWPAS